MKENLVTLERNIERVFGEWLSYDTHEQSIVIEAIKHQERAVDLLNSILRNRQRRGEVVSISTLYEPMEID